MPANEQVILEEGQVRITNLRAILGPKTYAMSNITSVTMAKSQPGTCLPFALLLGGAALLALFLLSAYSALSSPRTTDAPSWILLVVGAISLAIGIIVHRGAKPDYIVKIGSASGESNALSSRDRASIERIVGAMNQAIVMRG
jgi:hypothetical protein